MADLTGKILGKYQIIERLGRGGMADVYRAFQPGMDRDVAVKVMHEYLFAEGDFIERFKREARSVGALRHPNIVQVIDFDMQDEQYYMVMEYIRGETLKSRLKHEGAFPVVDALRIVVKLADALDYAHAAGMLHRDIKSANIMFSKEGEPVLTDFGIARLMTSTQLTSSGTVMGTPAYMSPEAGAGDKVDERTDIYSLGVVLYEMLTGRLPFEADTPYGLISKHISAPLPPPREFRPDLPDAANAVVLKALVKDREARYRNAAQMRDAAQSALNDLNNVTPVRPLPIELEKTEILDRDPTPAAVSATATRAADPTPVALQNPTAPLNIPLLARRRQQALSALAFISIGALITFVILLNAGRNRQTEIEEAQNGTSTAVRQTEFSNSTLSWITQAAQGTTVRLTDVANATNVSFANNQTLTKVAADNQSTLQALQATQTRNAQGGPPRPLASLASSALTATARAPRGTTGPGPDQRFTPSPLPGGRPDEPRSLNSDVRRAFFNPYGVRPDLVGQVEDGLKGDPRALDLLVLKGLLQLHDLTAVEQVGKLAQAIIKDAQNASEGYLLLGLYQLQRQNPNVKQALEAFKSAIDKGSTDFLTYWGRAQAQLLDTGYDPGAKNSILRDYDKAVELADQQRLADLMLIERGTYYFALSEYRNAEADFLEAQKLHDDAIKRIELAKLYVVTKRVKLAFDLFDTPLTYQQPDTDALYFSSAAYLAWLQGDKPKARDWADKATTLEPNIPAALYVKALIAQDNNQINEAVKGFSDLIDNQFNGIELPFIGPLYDRNLRVDKGRALWQKKDCQSAITAYQDYFTYDEGAKPDSPNEWVKPYLELGKIAVECKEIALARDILEKARGALDRTFDREGLGPEVQKLIESLRADRLNLTPRPPTLLPQPTEKKE